MMDSTLPVVDVTYPVDDQVAVELIDGSSNMWLIIQFLRDKVREIINIIDSVIIYKMPDENGVAMFSVSLLDFFIALTIFSMMFTLLFVTIRTRGVGDTVDFVADRVKSHRESRGL